MPTVPRNRSRRSDAHRARDIGFAAAMGIEVEIDLPEVEADSGRYCGSCGTEGRLDMVDATIQRAFLSCPACGRTWDTARLDQISV